MRIATFSKGIIDTPYLLELLYADQITLSPPDQHATRFDMVVGWGRKRNTQRAKIFAQKHAIPYYSLEDGFLRSMGLGRENAPSISLVVDKMGIYYDASQPSDLEELLNSSDEVFTPRLLNKAKQAIGFILEHRLSKYNGAPDMPTGRCSSDKEKALIIDQVADDASITYGSTGFSLENMITAAKDENPYSDIYVKLHPETIHGFRKGMFSDYKKDVQIQFIAEDYNPLSVLNAMDKVYTATSQLGFEALLLDKEVICFGMPFYAGWGLTDDRVICSRRVKKRSAEEVFAAAYILYSRYINPISGRRCDILEALEYLKLQKTKLNTRYSNSTC